jgi:CRP-like cAMP-binding protein/rhodanese-related sulfurtransferase
MDLDLNKFRTLVPINALYENSLMQLAKQARVEKLEKGDTIFSQGDHDQHSVYLMSGSIKLSSTESGEIEINAGTKQASYAMSASIPRKHDAIVTSETASLVWVNRVLLERLLAWGESSEQDDSRTEKAQEQGPSALDSEWMMAMLQSQIFLRLPAQNIQALFSRMVELDVQKGDIIVRFGEEGGFYYMVKTGRCQVSRPTDDGEEVLAEIGRGSSFGEESLLTNDPRNATITMLTYGKLMRLAKQDFIELLNEPILNWIDIPQGKSMIAAGACMVDVRTKAEYQNSGISGAVNIPLGLIRQNGPDLNPETKYILYCDTGQRSSTAAFLLSQMGLDVYVIKDGIFGS